LREQTARAWYLQSKVQRRNADQHPNCRHEDMQVIFLEAIFTEIINTRWRGETRGHQVSLGAEVDYLPTAEHAAFPSEHKVTFGSGRQRMVFVQVRKSALLLSLMLLWLGESIRFDRSENIHRGGPRSLRYNDSANLPCLCMIQRRMMFSTCDSKG
jgi:hypothetical protein